MRKKRQIYQVLIRFGFLSLVIWLLVTTLSLYRASKQPIGAFFVLGGSITRELYVAQLAKQYPHIPILISQGSKEPCIWLIFNRYQAPKQNVYLENCAYNTFTNFFYSVPILKQWKVKKVKVITSPTHLPRSIWMAKILLGAKGIWVVPDIVKEKGIPGNNEHWLKTILDITRSLLWAIVSQGFQPHCTKVIPLQDISLSYWQKVGFKCEKQAKLFRN